MSVSPYGVGKPTQGLRAGPTSTYPVIAGNTGTTGLVGYQYGGVNFAVAPRVSPGIPANPKRYGEKKVNVKSSPKSGAAQLTNAGKVKGIPATSGGGVPSAIQVAKKGNRGAHVHFTSRLSSTGSGPLQGNTDPSNVVGDLTNIYGYLYPSSNSGHLGVIGDTHNSSRFDVPIKTLKASPKHTGFYTDRGGNSPQ
jgi:hypothetical protein